MCVVRGTDRKMLLAHEPLGLSGGYWLPAGRPAQHLVTTHAPLAVHTSHVTHHTSHITHHTSHITRHTSHITHHKSHITNHTSHVTRHASHITPHTITSVTQVVSTTVKVSSLQAYVPQPLTLIPRLSFKYNRSARRLKRLECMYVPHPTSRLFSPFDLLLMSAWWRC